MKKGAVCFIVNGKVPWFIEAALYNITLWDVHALTHYPFISL